MAIAGFTKAAMSGWRRPAPAIPWPGVVAGLVARGAGPAQATIWGVYLHGQAGNRLARSLGPMGFLARELLAEIPGIMAELAH